MPRTDGQAVLGQRALNRALLARQMLLNRSNLSATKAIERLVGMQAQAPNLPYVGLWARLHGFQPEELSRLVRSRLARARLHAAVRARFIHGRFPPSWQAQNRAVARRCP